MKIGVTGNMEERFLGLCAQNASPLELFCTVDVGTLKGYLVERAIHAKFAGLRHHGEWFQATPELIEFARSGKVSALELDLRSRNKRHADHLKKAGQCQGCSQPISTQTLCQTFKDKKKRQRQARRQKQPQGEQPKGVIYHGFI